MKIVTSATILILLLSFVLVSVPEVRIVKAPPYLGVIRIMPDGTVEGTDKIERNGDIYTFTEDVNGYLNNDLGDLTGFLLVIKDNIIIDGAGYTIQGNGTGVGIFLRSMYNVTIKNLNIKGFAIGISFYVMDPVVPIEYPMRRGNALNNRILNNNITAADTDNIMTRELGGWGIYVEFANNTVISGNTITAQNPQKGVYFGSGCYNTTLLDNKFVGCGLYPYRLGQNVIHNNTIDGKPIVYLDGASNQVIEDAEQVFLFNCKNMTIENIHPSASYRYVIYLDETKNSEVTHCEGLIFLTDSHNNFIHDNVPKKIELSGSSYNKIFANSVLDTGVCMTLYGASNYNDIYGNTLSNSSSSAEADSLHYSGKNAVGVHLGDGQLGGCQYNNIYWNKIVNHDVGIESHSSANNSIYANIIAESNVGISLGGSNQNRIFQNNITDCGSGISINGASSNNDFYHNNFVNNRGQASESHMTLFSPIIDAYSENNTWDDGYPSGGNYWSDYNGTDADGDGIGDTPYIVYENYTDHYPLMAPVDVDFVVIPEFPLWTPILIFMVLLTTAIAVLRKKLRTPSSNRTQP